MHKPNRKRMLEDKCTQQGTFKRYFSPEINQQLIY